MTRRSNVFIAPSGEVYPARVLEEAPPFTVAFTTADQVDRSKVYRQQTERLEKELSKKR
jgi:hypothetical protein